MSECLALFTSAVPSTHPALTLITMCTPSSTLFTHAVVQYKGEIFVFTPLIRRTLPVMFTFYTSRSIAHSCKEENDSNINLVFYRDEVKIRIKFRIATDKQAQMFELLNYSISG